MGALTAVLRSATLLGLPVLTLVAIRGWRADRRAQWLHLSWSLAMLAFVTVAAPRLGVLPGAGTPVMTAAAVLALQAAGLGLTLFTASLLPHPRWAPYGASLALGASAAALIAAGPPHPGQPLTAPQWTLALVLGAAWSVCVGSSALRLWLAARGRPAARRARLRALAAAFVVIVAALLVAVLSRPPGNLGTVRPAMLGLVTTAVLLLWAAVAPPRWLRRRWRLREERMLHRAVQDLVTYAHDQEVIAERSLQWAIRLTGADAGVILDGRGTVLATSSDDVAGHVLGAAAAPAGDLANGGTGHTVAVDLPTPEGGRLVVTGDTFVPMFEGDEVAWLRTYGANVAAALERVRLTAALRASEQQLRALVEGVHDHALVILSADGVVAAWNGGAERLHRYRAGQIVGGRYARFFTADDAARDLPWRILRTAAAENRFEIEAWRVRGDGTRFWASAVVTPLRDETGAVTGFVELARDVTVRHRLEQLRGVRYAVTRTLSQAHAVEAAMERVLRTVCDGAGWQAAQLWLPGADAVTLRRAHAWAVTGARASLLLRASADLAVAPGEGMVGEVWRTGAPVVAGDLRDLSTDARAAEAEADGLRGAAAVPVLAEDRVAGVLEVFRESVGDVEEDALSMFDDVARQIGQFVARKRAEQALHDTIDRLQEVAATDPLTGLRNRREFERLLGVVPRQDFAVLAIDVDNLKQVNDAYGHEAGDVVLRSVAMTVSSLLRGWDVVARVGGDEFAALLFGAGGEDAALAGERMRRAVAATSTPYGQARVSVGWAAGPAGADAHAVHRQADRQLYRAKREGRDRVLGGGDAHDDGPPPGSQWGIAVEKTLDDRHVEIVFQPIVSLDGLTVLGHEALARPEGGDGGEGAEAFFAAAQHLGRIREIDWLCRRMAVMAYPWPAPERILFLNVSALTLLDPVHDVDQMLLLLRAAGGEPNRVVLEITEHEVISDLDRLRLVLAAYREHGFRFAVDDVGEGHSTLELIAAANPEFIKIARSLTMTAGRPPSRSAIRAAQAFAESNGGCLIAEGVETREAVDEVSGLGVRLAQGWYLGRPELARRLAPEPPVATESPA